MVWLGVKGNVPGSGRARTIGTRETTPAVLEEKDDNTNGRNVQVVEVKQ